MQKPDADSPQIHLALRHYTMNVAATQRQETSRRYRLGLLLLAMAWLFLLSIRVARSAQEDYTREQPATAGTKYEVLVRARSVFEFAKRDVVRTVTTAGVL